MRLSWCPVSILFFPLLVDQIKLTQLFLPSLRYNHVSLVIPVTMCTEPATNMSIQPQLLQLQKQNLLLSYYKHVLLHWWFPEFASPLSSIFSHEFHCRAQPNVILDSRKYSSCFKTIPCWFSDCLTFIITVATLRTDFFFILITSWSEIWGDNYKSSTHILLQAWLGTRFYTKEQFWTLFSNDL